MDSFTKASSDDEEDLEALRLAALQSLKKKNENGIAISQNTSTSASDNLYAKGSFRGGRKRFYSNQTSRNNRNGQFSNIRNSNLIAIPTLQGTNEDPLSDSSHRLILPQDRYIKSDSAEEKPESPVTKFDRYKDSDSESEEDDNDVENKLQRSDSLEAIMKELEEEIQGDSKVKRQKVKSSSSEDVTAPVESEVIVHSDVNETKEEETSVKENVKPSNETFVRKDYVKNKFVKGGRRRTPPQKKRNFHQPPPLNSFIPPLATVATFIPEPQFASIYNNIPPFGGDIYTNVPPFAPPPVAIVPNEPHLSNFIPSNIPPRPLSPLSINTDPFTVPIGSLSPRSAAFVLENRAIVEKRKRSPRRSYSRSPSPRYRRSKSPRRSPSLRRSSSPRRSPNLRRSPSPRTSPSLKRFPSPRRSSSLRRSTSPRRSPIRRSLSPVRRKGRSPKPLKPSVHQRLGVKPPASEKVKKEADPIPKEDKTELDPILEARKKKFETNEIKIKEGVIRLKPKTESPEDKQLVEKPPIEQEIPSQEVTTKEEEDLLLDDEDEDLLAKIDELFTDDETDDDKEGRFKARTQRKEKVPILPYTKLVNSGNTPINASAEAKKESTPPKITRTTARTKAKILDTTKTRETSKEKISSPRVRNETCKSILKTGSRRLDKEPLTSPIKNRKFEIKIKNPSKYEKADDAARKVELTKENLSSGEEFEPELIVDNEDDVEIENTEGDLRAQLSKKRAKRQKHSTVEGVQSRLLQNALEGAVFKKKRKTKKSTDNIQKEVKLPIRMRLGIAADSETFKETKPRKKSKKRKNRNSDQVLCFVENHFILISRLFKHFLHWLC